MLVPILALTGFTGVRADGEDCRALSVGYNGLSYEETCYALDVAESTDMLRLSSYPSSYYSGSDASLELSGSADPSQPSLCWFGGSVVCTIPGPEATHMYVHILAYPRHGSPLGVVVEFVEAVPVTGGTVDTFRASGDGRMYRFDGLPNAAIISLASGDDVDLSVRRGSPPTRDKADCVSARHDGRGPGAETCLLEAGAGPVYAFVKLWRQTSVSLDVLPGFGDACTVTGGLIFLCEYPGQFAISGTGA